MWQGRGANDVPQILACLYMLPQDLWYQGTAVCRCVTELYSLPEARTRQILDVMYRTQAAQTRDLAQVSCVYKGVLTH